MFLGGFGGSDCFKGLPVFAVVFYWHWRDRVEALGVKNIVQMGLNWVLKTSRTQSLTS